MVTRAHVPRQVVSAELGCEGALTQARALPCASALGRAPAATHAREVLGWIKICKLAHACPWEYSYKRLELAQLLGQLGGSLTG
jgi:hypothetical protein